jgi:hypothetical protein
MIRFHRSRACTCLVDLAAEGQLPRPVGLHRLHERVGHQHRQVEHAQPRRVGLGGDEVLDIRMVAAHRGHHRAAARACRHDRAAHRVPDIHEDSGPRHPPPRPFHRRALGPDGREVVADAAALLHGQRGLFQHASKMPPMLSGIVPMTKQLNSVTDRPCPPRRDPARGKVAEILERLVEALFPRRRVGFSTAASAPAIRRHVSSTVVDRAADRRSFRKTTVLHVPDLFGDRRGETGHG